MNCSTCGTRPAVADALCDQCWHDREYDAMVEAYGFCSVCHEPHSDSTVCLPVDDCTCGGRGVCPSCDPGEWFEEPSDAALAAAYPDEASPLLTSESFQARLAALRDRSRAISAAHLAANPPRDEREWADGPRAYTPTFGPVTQDEAITRWWQDEVDAEYVASQAAKYAYRSVGRRAWKSVPSPAQPFIGPLPRPAGRPLRKAQVTDGWVTGERELYFAQLQSGPALDPDTRTEGERLFDFERELIEYRAFKVVESFRSKVAYTHMAVADGEMSRRDASRRIWGLGKAEERILAELRVEYAEVELDPRSDDELIEQRRVTENDEAQARSEIRSAARRLTSFASETEEIRHQAFEESEMMRAEAKVAWVEGRVQENATDLRTALDRYFTEFGTGEWTNESLFPMWVERDGKWRLEGQTLRSIYAAEVAKRGESYKALWTMAKMVDTRYEAQLRYRASKRRSYTDVRRFAA